MVGFYARFIPEVAEIVADLHELKKKGVRFVWGEQHQRAFKSLKGALCGAPVLQIAEFDRDFVLVTDSSDRVVSAVLHQRLPEGLAPLPSTAECWHGRSVATAL